MYYEQRRPKKRRRRSRYEGPGCLGRLLRLLIALLLVWAIASAGCTVIVDGGWTDVLLLGVDHDAGGTSRSDTMIVASLGPLGQVRLTSIMRDTWVDIPGHGYGKINAAYRYGGPELAMETVNSAFGLDIRQYVVISLRTFPMLIDSLGGVTLDITKEEAYEINANLDASRSVLKKTGVDTSYLEQWGQGVHLTGAQALSYARIRSIGSDYARTSRQRQVLEAMLVQARSVKNPLVLIDFVKTALSVTKTNICWPQIAALGLFALIRNDVEQLRLPADGTFESGTYDGVWCIKPDFAANRALLEEFLSY
ncbi:MAG: LCP family protein [Eubacteriales bacterium]|nr:LCP family protein [Eubacteriales bacterium]